MQADKRGRAAELTVRPATAQDDPYEIGAVYVRSWQSAYSGLLPADYLKGLSASRWRVALDTGGRQTAVACEAGRIVGVCTFGQDRRDAALGEIVSLYLLPDWVGRGAGTRLFAYALRALADAGFGTARLWVLEGNARARRFYEKFGFAPGPEIRRDEIGGRRVREVEYRRALTEAREAAGRS